MVMAAASEAVPDEIRLDAFRDQLRDGLVRASFHGARGEPLAGVLELQPDKTTLVWRNTGRFQCLQQKTASVNLRDVRSVREGRQTTNFVRTIKYVEDGGLPESDDRCLSLCTPPPASESEPTSDSDVVRLVDEIATLDLEFEDAATRNIARSFFLAEANLSGTIDLCDASEVQQPRGLSTRCYQLVTHPSFELLVFAAVASTVLFIALQPFTAAGDDEQQQQQLVPTKPKLTENLSHLEVLLLVLLTVEQAAKVVALEGLHPVLRRRWDAFDFAVVCVSWLAMAPSASLAGFNMLSLRLLRCARMFKSWRGFHEVVETFVAALPMAGSAVLCYCYYLFLFAVLGMYLFNDSLSHRCAVPLGPATSAAATSGFAASGLSTQVVGGVEYVAAFPGRFCRLGAASDCVAPLECVTMTPPNNGLTGFHSFEASFATVFLISLRSGFGSALDGALQASSYVSIVYFIALMVFVSYMILSLFVGIVRGSYVAVTIHRASHLEARARAADAYEQRHRVPFPRATDAFPDVLELAADRWREYRRRARDTVLRSPLFTPAEDPDAAFLSRFRLRPHRVFFMLEPGSAAMDRLAAVGESVLFEHAMNVVVFANSVLFAFEYHGMSATYAARLYAVENALVFVYAAEFVVVCANAGGLLPYLRHPWNRLDFVLLAAALLESACLAASLFLYSERYARAIFVLRIFRVVRPFRVVVRHKNGMGRVLDAVLASVPAFLGLAACHALLTSVFAVVGMNLFGGRFPRAMRSHFNTFGDSALTLFKVACGGNTWQIFHASLQASAPAVALAYYLAYCILCVFLLLNFMLVVLLRNFAMNEDERRTTLADLFQERVLVMQRIHHFDEYAFLQQFSELYARDVVYATLAGSAAKRAKLHVSAAEELKLRLLSVLPVSDFLKLRGRSHPLAARGSAGAARGSANTHKYQRLDGAPSGGGGDDAPSRLEPPPLPPKDDETAVVVTYGGGGARGYVRRFCRGDWLTSDVSLFLFPPHSRFRLKCKRLEKETDKFIFTAIVIRSVLLTVQSPLYSALLQEFNALCDLAFALTLLFEFAIKVVSRGFLFTPRSYLSNRFNQLNMLVLLACSLLLLLPHSTLVALFRLSRAFGPIRVFYRVKTFRVITAALQQSAKQVCYCVVVAAFLFYSFATVGMQCFAGKFSFCNDPSVAARAHCHGVFASPKHGLLMPRVWGNLAGLHFDNIGGALSSVVVLVSKKGWLPVLNLAMDMVDGDHQPVQNASAYAALFFVLLIFFARFFLLKVFAGILVNNFRCYNGTLLLSNLQLIWMRTKQGIRALRPKYPLPRNALLLRAHMLVQTRRFRLFSSATVLLHTMLLAWYHGGSTSGVWWCHYLFSLVYALDAIMCVVSMGWKDFLMKGFTWRTANSFTAFVMLVGPLVARSPVLLVLGTTRALDFQHLARVVERLDALRTVFETLLGSVRLMLKVTLLLGYVLFVFATVGMQLFALTRWSYGLDANLNYATFPGAFAAFVKFTAGEDWYDSYLASSVGPPQCTAAGFFSARRHASDCGSAVLSGVFYHVFYVLVVLVLQNLYVATIVDTFVSISAVGANKDAALELLGFKAEHLKQFQAVWSEFDTSALGYLHKKHLLAFLTRLDAPLGLGAHQATRDALAAEEHAPPPLSSSSSAHRQRREAFHDVEARIAEFSFRVRVIQDHELGADLACPGSMMRFTDLLLVLAGRVVPLDSLTVQEKVDELAVRGYVVRHRQAVRVQAAFRMFRVLRRQRWRRRPAAVSAPAPAVLTATTASASRASDTGGLPPSLLASDALDGLQASILATSAASPELARRARQSATRASFHVMRVTDDDDDDDERPPGDHVAPLGFIPARAKSAPSVALFQQRRRSASGVIEMATVGPSPSSCFEANAMETGGASAVAGSVGHSAAPPNAPLSPSLQLMLQYEGTL
ncbi:hypothetical protein PybrP1_008061 [[Pythium] brassicae (nom. inval.)]|nr:hypothetical protein PybrP1_008061 [[Pythium] brassicae (nom. inval.)]